MNVSIPPAVLSMGPVLSEFFEAMVHKLNVNSHKKAITEDDIDGLLAKLQDEIQEFRDERIKDAEDYEQLLETVDAANFCFLLYAFLRNRGVRDLRERFIEEFYSVDTHTGRVFCKRTRAGSPLKEGEEVKGTTRNGVVYIRAQHTASGATISVARRDIVWWAATSRWPERPLRYKSNSYNTLHQRDNIDAFENLELTPEKPGPKYPFVTQYKPKGKEKSQNYGKWVYQRRHAFKLIRVGYWDTPEEAAREGLRTWKEKTRNV